MNAEQPSNTKDLGVRERIYRIPAEKREWYIRYRTEILRWYHEQVEAGEYPPAEELPPPRKSYAEFLRRIDGVKQGGEFNSLRRFVIGTMTDQEREEYFVLSQQRPFIGKVRHWVANLFRR